MRPRIAVESIASAWKFNLSAILFNPMPPSRAQSVSNPQHEPKSLSKHDIVQP
jgi:hypothetical protein